MFMRRRPLMRAAVVGGGAYAIGHHMGTKSDGNGQQQGQQEPARQEPAQQQSAQQAAGPASQPSMLDRLDRLEAMHQQGTLSDSEFSAAKAKLLG